VELYPEVRSRRHRSVEGEEIATRSKRSIPEQNPVYVGNINAPRQIVIAVPMKVWTKYGSCPKARRP